MSAYTQLCEKMRAEPSTWLVTGVAGFIGSNLLEHLLKMGQTVVGLDNLNDYYDVQLKKDRLARLEAEGSEDLDAVSGCFGELMAELFDYKQDHWSPELRSIGFHLGKFIYLLDAYDDLARDEKKGAYNPLRTLSRQPGYEEEMRDIFELLLARCARSFERLPCVEDADLLRNILYSGVWLKYNCKQAKEAPKK